MLHRSLKHPVGRALISDRPTNSFIMVVYEICLKVQSKFLKTDIFTAECESSTQTSGVISSNTQIISVHSEITEHITKCLAQLTVVSTVDVIIIASVIMSNGMWRECRISL